MGFREEIKEEKTCASVGSLEIWDEKNEEISTFFFFNETNESGGGAWEVCR